MLILDLPVWWSVTFIHSFRDILLDQHSDVVVVFLAQSFSGRLRLQYRGREVDVEYVQVFFSYIFLGVFVYMEYLCRPSEASTRYCVIPGGYPPQDWQSLPCAGEELDSNPGLLICSQVQVVQVIPPELSSVSGREVSCLIREVLASIGQKKLSPKYNKTPFCWYNNISSLH